MFLAGALMISLSGCDPESPTPTETAGASSPAPTESPTASVTPTAEPFVADCSSIIPQSRRDWVASSTWTLFPPADFFAKNRSEVSASPYILMQDNGGIVCPYSTGLEVVLAYGYAPLADSQVAEADSLIMSADPYTTSSYAGGTLYTSGMDGNPFTYFLIVPGAIYLASTVEIIDEMMATIP